MHSLTVYSNVYMTSQSFVSSCSMLVLLRGIHWKGGQDSLRKEGGKKKKKGKEGLGFRSMSVALGSRVHQIFQRAPPPTSFFSDSG